jgi:uncharacterized protein (DUF2336 family)
MLSGKMLDKTTAVTKFHKLINEIQDHTTSGSIKKQLRALTRLTDLFAAGASHYSGQQVELFGEVFKTLVAVIELKTRVKLARHLATSPDAPAALVRAFAFDEAIAVAAPVLSQSMVLSDADLAVSAGTQSQGHLFAIAQRRTISEAITEILIHRGEPKVVHAVAGNPGARISDGSFCELVARSAADAELALRVGVRHDIPRHQLLKLLETASASVRRKIVAANPQFADAVQDAVTGVVDDINLEVRGRSVGHAKARRRVKLLARSHELRETNVHAAARAQNFEQMVMALSVLAGCPIEMAERAVLHENPGVALVLAKAAGCSWATVKLVLLIEGADRRMSGEDLDRARESFEQLEPRTAKRVLEFYGTRRRTRAGASLPLVPEVSAAQAALTG